MEDYCEKLYIITADNHQLAGIKRQITGKEFLEALNSDLTIKHEVGHLFLIKPNFERYTEVDEIFTRMVNMEKPNEKRWEQLCETID